MDVNDEQFWAALRREVEQAEALEREQLAETEQQLAAGDAAADDPLTEQQIDAIVQAALARDAAAERAAEQAAAHAAAPVHAFARVRHVLAAAAAILIAPQFLLAATVVAAVTVTTVLLRHTAQTLPFERAVRILMDTTDTDGNRSSALGRVAFDLQDSFAVLTAVAAEDTPVAAPALAVLGRLRTQFAQPAAYQPKGLAGDLVQLTDTVADHELGTAARLDALQPLSEQLAHGLSAMQAIALAPGGGELPRLADVWIESLRKLLD